MGETAGGIGHSRRVMPGAVRMEKIYDLYGDQAPFSAGHTAKRTFGGAFSGSLPDFLATFLGNFTISDKEEDEIREIIDQYARKHADDGEDDR